jgi:hypothetical protein
MMALLNWRVWAAIGLALALALSHGFIYRAGKATVRADWDKERLAQVQAAALASEARRMKERSLSLSNEGIANAYIKEKAVLVAAQRATDDKLRELQAALGGGAGVDSAPLGGADDPRDAIIDQCAGALVGLDKEARGLALKAIGLQNYASKVCLAR